jgi:hypothetical protein
MSKVKIEGNASGTGTFTIAAPNSNTDRTFNLPDEAGTVLTSASDLPAANLTGTLPAIDGSNLTNLPGGGKVLQFVYGSITSQDNTSSSTYATVKSLSITPTSSSSKLISVWGFSVGHTINQNDSNGAIRIYNTVGGYTVMENQWNTHNATGYGYGQQGSTWMAIDAPGSTSVQTHAFQIARYQGSNLFVNAYNDTQWCYIMEVAG